MALSYSTVEVYVCQVCGYDVIAQWRLISQSYLQTANRPPRCTVEGQGSSRKQQRCTLIKGQ